MKSSGRQRTAFPSADVSAVRRSGLSPPNPARSKCGLPPSPAKIARKLSGACVTRRNSDPPRLSPRTTSNSPTVVPPQAPRRVLEPASVNDLLATWLCSGAESHDAMRTAQSSGSAAGDPRAGRRVRNHRSRRRRRPRSPGPPMGCPANYRSERRDGDCAVRSIGPAGSDQNGKTYGPAAPMMPGTAEKGPTADFPHRN